jgi:uncharacterized protein
MDQTFFVNLPVENLATSSAFYEALGFTANPDFSDEASACFIVNAGVIVMLMTHERFEAYSSRRVLNSRSGAAAFHMLTCSSRVEVDAKMTAALAAGGTETGETEDEPHMYARSLADPDGHIWEFAFIDMDQLPE